MKKIIFGVVFSFIAINCFAGPGYQTGKITNLTAGIPGIMIMIDNGLPDNCEGSPSGWMLIKQEHTVLTSVVLAAWVSGKSTGTVYTTGRENGTGFCLINQFDPVN
ncbi:MAG: hypothetical protein KUG79_04175 [Pseudomonadales bacterium]|nr:hypothetical protein [Pseudomonadales bacterium]